MQKLTGSVWAFREGELGVLTNKKIKVLLADNHPVVRQGLKASLTPVSWIDIIHETGNGKDAYQKVLELNPDIIVVDLHLPGKSALELAHDVYGHDRTFGIIIFTDCKDEEPFQEAMSFGVRGYLLKSCTSPDILNCIEKVMEGRRFVSTEFTEYLLDRRFATEKLKAKQPGLDQLTMSEYKILKMVASDRTSKEIAEKLCLSPRTIETHRSIICNKLSLVGSHSLVKFAFQNRERL